MWRFESVHSFASVGNLYQKMHFAGSNLSTDPKCIYKIHPLDSLFCGKATAVEKPVQGFSKSRLSSPSINKPKQKTTVGVVFCFGRDSWTRTNEMQESKSCALTDLAISLCEIVNIHIIHIFFALVK